MMDFITAPLVVGIVVFGLYKFFELLICRKERMMWIQFLIQKSDSLPDSDEMKKIKFPSTGNVSLGKFTSLRWGCLVAGLGLGITVAFLVSHWMNYCGDVQFWGYDFDRFYAPIYGACTLLFAGIGLIISYVVEWKAKK